MWRPLSALTLPKTHPFLSNKALLRLRLPKIARGLRQQQHVCTSPTYLAQWTEETLVSRLQSILHNTYMWVPTSTWSISIPLMCFHLQTTTNWQHITVYGSVRIRILYIWRREHVAIATYWFGACPLYMSREKTPISRFLLRLYDKQYTTSNPYNTMMCIQYMGVGLPSSWMLSIVSRSNQAATQCRVDGNLLRAI